MNMAEFVGRRFSRLTMRMAAAVAVAGLAVVMLIARGSTTSGYPAASP